VLTTISKVELAAMLALHTKWLNGEKYGVQAVFNNRIVHKCHLVGGGFRRAKFKNCKFL
jgi:hypothetical protein